MFIVFLISTSSFVLKANVKLSAANGKGGVYLKWSGIKNSKDYYYIVEQMDESNVWKQISTYKQGTRVNVLNVYPSRCSKPNWFYDEGNISFSCQASRHNGYNFQTYNVSFSYDTEDNEKLHELPKSAALKVWMEGGYIYEDNVRTRFEPYGKRNGVGDQIIHVSLMSLDEFHNYLNDTNWKSKLEKSFDVIVFGTWDASASFLITDEDTEKVKEYLDDGYGVLTGHDCLCYDFYNEKIGVRSLLKIRYDFGVVSYKVDSYLVLNRTIQSYTFTPTYVVQSYYGNSYAYVIPAYLIQSLKIPYYSPEYSYIYSNSVQITRKGLLTNFPWEIGDVGTNLRIPKSHTTYHASFGTVWMQFNDFDKEPEQYTGLNHNFYLSTYNNAAIIQTGHSNCDSTEDERKLLANTIYYLKQRTYDQFVLDHSSQDLKGPLISNIKQNDRAYSITFKSVDLGSKYSFQVKAIKKNNSYDFIKSNIETVEVKTGIKSIKYIINPSSKKPSIEDFFKASNSNSRISILFDKNLYIKYCQYSYYIYIVGFDKAGNHGEIEQYQFKSLPTQTRSQTRSQSQSISQSQTRSQSQSISQSQTRSQSQSISQLYPVSLAFNLGNKGQTENNVKGKPHKFAMYGAIGSCIAAAIVVGTTIFLIKHTGGTISTNENDVGTFDNIPHRTTVGYENPLYVKNNGFNFDDPFSEDFN